MEVLIFLSFESDHNLLAGSLVLLQQHLSIAKRAGFSHRRNIMISRLYFALQVQQYKNGGDDDHWRSASATPSAPPASPAVQGALFQ